MIYHSLRYYSLSHNIIFLIFIALIYFFSGLLGLLFAVPETYVTPLWPPSGVALAAVLLFGYRTAISIFIGSVLANSYELMQLVSQPTLLQFMTTTLMTGTGATLQAVVNAALVQYFIPQRYIFSDSVSILKFYLIAMFSCLINSNMGALSLILNGVAPLSNYFDIWKTWWIGDITGIFVITPLIIIWTQQAFSRFSIPQFFELLLILFIIFLTTFLTWKFNLRLSIILVACLVWTAIRLQCYIAPAMMLLITAITALQTTHFSGPFAGESMDDALIYLALFICVLSAINLILCAEFSKPKNGPHQWRKSPRFILYINQKIRWIRVRFKK